MASENGMHPAGAAALPGFEVDGPVATAAITPSSMPTGMLVEQLGSNSSDSSADGSNSSNVQGGQTGGTELSGDPHAAAQEQQRAELEARLKETANSLFTVGLSVYDFQPGSDALLRQRVNGLVTQYSELMALGSGLDTMVPEEVIRYVEDGRNPDLFSREFTERAVAENQFANGRMAAFECFKQQLEEELGGALPADVMQAYQKQMGSGSQ
ncbi:transcription factor subunit Med10 of mediator complex-domain-containing protein [Thamnocephalis sphaerospora]|uniref:Mediator of RNA polymerase II transcription subunit 10 n=1 Tax=Thamnocephalis sphaerospora TaxID=78915 RepID=A0A4P9XGP4_9FUNG|nr:transcription factor subunit Med10 of mediator complex-domain-containing protein [Thamnocephalis sphaerospora]|eukprot:RKP04816.1 transcription factor subunit Med10 of mediator complex-domain-containing protein [Thamnocephalis sphaerospora]